MEEINNNFIGSSYQTCSSVRLYLFGITCSSNCSCSPISQFYLYLSWISWPFPSCLPIEWITYNTKAGAALLFRQCLGRVVLCSGSFHGHQCCREPGCRPALNTFGNRTLTLKVQIYYNGSKSFFLYKEIIKSCWGA